MSKEPASIDLTSDQSLPKVTDDSVKKPDFDYRPIDELNLYQQNPVVHTPEQIRLIAWSIAFYGWTNPVQIQAGTNLVIAGHGRIAAAKLLGLKKVPVSILDHDENESRGSRIMDNRSAQLAEIDKYLLKGELVDLDAAGFNLGFTGYNGEYLADAMGREWNPQNDGLTDDDAVPSVPKKAHTKTGDLYLLGNHKLLCGDCKDPEAIERLLGEQKISLLNTDPPYGVNYVAKARDMEKAGYGHSHAATDIDIEADDMTGAELTDFLVSSLGLAIPFLSEKAAIYVWHPDARRREFMNALDQLGIFVHQIVIWLKPGFVIGRCNYHHRFEPAFHGWIKNNRPEFLGPRNQSNVWDVAREMDKIHPTQKPVELFTRPIENHTQPGDLIYEPFSGSGTQFIAAEKTGRRCFGMEIEPTYCDVIVKRWEDFTGKKAQLLTA